MTRDESPSESDKASDAAESRVEPPKARAGLDEAKINAPSVPDLVMLSVICAATLIMWAAGRAACNYHVPGESLTPRKVSLEERTRLPKNVGIEFAQAVSSGDFTTASELAVGSASEFIKKEKAACGACEDRKKLSKKLLSVGTVLQANSVDSIVSVRTVGGAGGDNVRVLGIERSERKWRVSRVYATQEEATLKESPEGEDAPPGLRRPLEPSEESAERAP